MPTLIEEVSPEDFFESPKSERVKAFLDTFTYFSVTEDRAKKVDFALPYEGYTVGIPSLGSNDTIAPAVTKGNTILLNWLNNEIKSLGQENFFHKDYEATLVDTYGLEYENSLVVEGGVIK